MAYGPTLLSPCVIYMVLGSFFSLPMLWESSLLSLMVKFTNSTLGSHSLDSTRHSGAYPSIESCRRSSDPDPGPRIPFLILGRPHVLWHYSCGQHFSCGMIDIVESMSRRVFLTAVCAPPSVSFFLNAMLSAGNRLCAMICMS